MATATKLNIVLMIPISFMFLAKVVSAQVYVPGYQKKDGTFVQPHFRSQADGNTSNNWSNKGNVNPYTGEWGTKGEYSPQMNLPNNNRPLAGQSFGNKQRRTIQPNISTYGNPANYGQQGIRRTPLRGGRRR